MNKIQYLFLISVILATSFSCCKDDDNKPSDENKNFSEYFTCKINGVEFDPQGSFNCNSLGFYYYEANTGGLVDKYMVIYGKDCPGSKTMAIRLFGMEHQVGYLNLLEPSFADSCSPAFIHYIEPGFEIEMDSLISGAMNITTFTPRDSITEKLGKLEGTFEFTIANQDSTIHITDGAFRFKVPNIW